MTAPTGDDPQRTGGVPTTSGTAPAWTPADAQRDTGPVQVLGPGGAAANVGRGGPAGVARIVDPARLLGLIVVVLGVLNFLWGFLPEITLRRSDESLSVFAVGPAYVPVLLLIAGLLALAAFLKGSEVSRLAVAAVSVGGAAGAIVSLGTESSVQIAFGAQAGKGVGAILLVIFGIIQAVVAIGGYVVGADAPPWLRAAGTGPAGSPGLASSPGYAGPTAAAEYAGPADASARTHGRWSRFEGSGYQPPLAPNSAWAEPATGPQFVVGPETGRDFPQGGTAQDRISATSGESRADPEPARTVGEAPTAPPRAADPETQPPGDDPRS